MSLQLADWTVIWPVPPSWGSGCLCRGSGQVETTLSSPAPVPRVGKERGGAVCLKGVREPINNLGKDAVPGTKRWRKEGSDGKGRPRWAKSWRAEISAT